MQPPTPRPSTPPPASGLLTPPSTGGVCKRTFIAGLEEATQDVRRQTKVEEGDALTEFFINYNEVSGTEVEDGDDDSDSSSARTGGSLQRSTSESFTAATTVSTASTTREPVLFDNTDLLTSHVEAANATTSVESFPFLKLPLSIRHRVYEHLLVIPATTCVRQRHTAFHDDRKAFLYAERRELLPGIAYALSQVKVGGLKTRFSRFAGININILRASKEVSTEARAVMYSSNDFEIVKPTDELTPQPDFSIPLFPAGYQHLVARLNVRIRTFYDLHWLLSGGCNVIKNHYWGLNTLTLILEIDTASKGFGRQWGRKKDEKWVAYINRLQGKLAGDLFDGTGPGIKTIPTCLNLRVLFNGEAYRDSSDPLTFDVDVPVTDDMESELAKREELRSALTETWELFKRGGK